MLVFKFFIMGIVEMNNYETCYETDVKASPYCYTQKEDSNVMK